MEVIDDNKIINIFITPKGKINPNRTNKKWLDNHNDIKMYLLNRYPNDDFISYLFTVKRIINNIEELPRCQACGKKLYNIYGKWCNSKCQLTDRKFIDYRTDKIDWVSLGNKIHIIKTSWDNEKKQLINEKVINTKIKRYGDNYGKEIYKLIKESNIKKYGVENVFQLDEIKEKSKQTCLEKYGDENFKNPEKTKETIKNRYNIDNWMSSSEFIKKSKRTKLEKYGDENYTNKEKSKQTCMLHYGVDNWGKTEESKRITHTTEINNKREATKRKNHTFNTSKTETESYKLLKEKYPDVLYQYKSAKYPFACDFYIPSLDLYIECNYHWTHGSKPYEGTNEDNLILEHWKSKNTKFYNNAINCWTIRDVKKRNIAKENNLNYLEFWNINELKEWIYEN